MRTKREMQAFNDGATKDAFIAQIGARLNPGQLKSMGSYKDRDGKIKYGISCLKKTLSVEQINDMLKVSHITGYEKYLLKPTTERK